MAKKIDSKSLALRAAHIAACTLFINGVGERATRLVLVDEKLGKPGRDLGGWCLGAVRDQIEAAIKQAIGEQEPRKKVKRAKPS